MHTCIQWYTNILFPKKQIPVIDLVYTRITKAESIYQVYTRYIPCLNFLGFPDVPSSWWWLGLLVWHIMTKSRKTLLLHLWHFYYCHYDISNILWYLWLLWHYYLHYCILNYYNTYDIEVLLLAIMTIAKHYVHYIYYNTIISIIAFWTIITLMTLRHYYSLLWQLQNIMRISTNVIMAINCL